MRGKRRPSGERTSNVAGPLPPCKICGQEGAGFHYGANTCEACKGFFSRSLLRKEEYQCLGDGNCPIMSNRRKSCPKCRYQKCVAIGMSKDAIKTGRYTDAKRAQDLEEIRQLNREGKYPLSIKDQVNGDHLSPFIVHELFMKNKPSKNQCPATSSYPSRAPVPSVSPTNSSFNSAFQFFETKTRPNLFDPMNQMKIEPNKNVGEEEASKESEEQDEEKEADGDEEYFDGLADCKSLENFKSFNGEEFYRCCKTITNLDIQTEDSDSPSPELGWSLASPSEHQAMPQSAIMSIIISTKPDLPIVTLPPSVVNYTWSPEFISRPGHDAMWQSFREDQMDVVIKQLVDSHRRYIVDTNEFSNEYFEERFQQCMDECRLKQELFGNLRPLMKKEYDKIFYTTGIDVDGRMANLSYSVRRFEEQIHSVVAFCKTIPEFFVLHLGTQLSLLKGAILDISTIGFHKGCDQKRRIMVETNRSYCEHDLYAWEGTEKEIDRAFQLMSDLKSLKLTFEMCVILKTICLFNPERVNDSEDLPKVEQAHNKYVQCLNRLLQLGRRGLEKPTMSAIGSTIQSIRFQYLSNRKTFHELKMIQYKAIYDSKAILEVLD